jgi:CHAT domain-containing protein
MIALYQYDVVRKIICVLLSFLSFAASSGQCPDKDFLEKRISNGGDSAGRYSHKQLIEFHGYLDKIQNCSYRNDSTHARLIKKIGSIYYQEADYLKAIEYYRQSINIITANANKSSINIAELPGSYYWLSMMYEALNMVNERMMALDSCYRIAMRIRNIDPACLRALYEWGKHSFDVGDYHRCIDYMRQCESLLKERPKLVSQQQGEQFLSGSLLWQTKALLELRNYKDVEKMLTDRIEECKRAGLKNNLGTIFTQLAELQLRKGNYNGALLYYNKAFRNDQQAGYDFNCKQTLKDIGYNIYFQHANDLHKAQVYYTRALRIINKEPNRYSEDKSESLDLFRLIANVFAERTQYDLAYRYFQLAFDQIRPGTDEVSILHSSQEAIKQFKKIHYLTSLIIDKADAYRKQYEMTRQPKALQEATRIYKTADLFLDKIRTEQSDLQSKLFWREDSRRLYENAIEACYLNNNIEDAFYFFEKGRAVLLQDQLNEQRWLGQADIMQRTQLNKRILQLERELVKTDASSNRHLELETELFNSKQELERIEDLVKTNNPLYYQNFVRSDSVSVKDLRQKILNNSQTLIELFAGNNAIYVLVISPTQWYLQKIGKQEFDSLSNAYTGYFSHPELLNKDFGNYKRVSARLYRLIFKNITLPAGRVIISPDGRYFPFEALITAIQPLTYFVEDYSVSYTYSARYLLNNFAANSEFSDHTFMGMAPVQYSNHLPALTGSDKSLQKIQHYFRNATKFVGHKASKSNFLREYYKCRIIQLYTHATDGGDAGEPEIYFSDSVLSLSELFYENKPTTRLIVLSACETADGKLYNGEGVFSFNRQFAALGIPSAVSTLWEVDNLPTYKLTELFYKYVADGIPLDLALQKAKKEFIETAALSENKLPYYWAASILVGQSNEIILQKPFPWKWVGVLSILLVLGVFGWTIKKQIPSTHFGTMGELLHG